MNLLSIGNNSKLGKKIAIFNLPARKTCPGATAYCGKVCYAMKAERMYKAAAAMRARNYAASLDQVNFVFEMTHELSNFKGDKVRIHESGDFYSQQYLDTWMSIASHFPKITFLAYTKMYDKLDFSKKPANLVIYASYDPTTREKIGSGYNIGLHECVIVEDETAFSATASWYNCPPVSKDHHNYCGVSCNVCWAGSNNVIFQKH